MRTWKRVDCQESLEVMLTRFNVHQTVFYVTGVIDHMLCICHDVRGSRRMKDRDKEVFRMGS